MNDAFLVMKTDDRTVGALRLYPLACFKVTGLKLCSCCGTSTLNFALSLIIIQSDLF